MPNVRGLRPQPATREAVDSWKASLAAGCGRSLHAVHDKVLLEEVKKALIPIQMCEVEAQPVFSPSIGEVVGYMMQQQMPGD